MTRVRLTARQPTYVPEGGPRDFLLAMSKADLAELVWDYAVRTVGEDARPLFDLAIQEIAKTAEALRYVASRRLSPRVRR